MTSIADPASSPPKSDQPAPEQPAPASIFDTDGGVFSDAWLADATSGSSIEVPSSSAPEEVRLMILRSLSVGAQLDYVAFAGFIERKVQEVDLTVFVPLSKRSYMQQLQFIVLSQPVSIVLGLLSGTSPAMVLAMLAASRFDAAIVGTVVPLRFKILWKG